MKNRSCILFVLAVSALLSADILSSGQEVPSLPADPNVSKGVLPDGISFYLSVNKTEKGLVEFALVQKRDPKDSVFAAGRALAGVPRLGGCNAHGFMARNGLCPGEIRHGTAGIAETRDDAVVYRFGTLHTSRGEAAVDSTLLMMFGIVEKACADGMPNSSNAIIIAGDIDKDAMLKKLGLFSLMVPSSGTSAVADESYRWQPADSAICEVIIDSTAALSTVKVKYSSTRTPRNMTGTVLPLVSERLGDIMGTILKKRLYTELKRNGVPVASVSYKYYKSTDQAGDEQYEVIIKTGERHTVKAVQVAAAVLSDIDCKGVLPKEFVDARGEYLIRLYGQSLSPAIPNRDYVDRCISSFLYGSDLSSNSDRFKFFVRGKVADSTQTRMFNRFVSGLIDSTANLTLAVSVKSAFLSESELLEKFNASWRERYGVGTYISYAANQNDTISMDTAAEKIKVKSTRTDPVSGGTSWRFDNGVNVVYKRMSTGGLFYYTMVIRGGYSAMKDIKRGEGAFLSDMLETYNICGLKSEDFHYLMLSNGITMSSRVGLSDMRLSGTAPRPSLTLLMKSLAAVANSRSIDPDNFEYYRECEKLVLEAGKNDLSGRKAAIDSLICPSYNYSSDKTLHALYPDLQERAMAFFDEQFSRVNDGVLVIVGDMEETAMRKFLQQHLGAFRTQANTAVRVKLPYQPISGWTTYTVDGEKPSVDVAMSSPLQFSAENYMASKIAALAVQDAFNEALCGTGTSARVASEMVMYPQERYNMMISVENVPLDMLPEGETHEDAINLLYRIREILSSLSSTPLPDAKIKVYKAMLSDELTSRQADPHYWLSVVTARYVEGKDLNTKYKDKIDAVNAAKIQDIMTSLNMGSKVEYVVK